MIFYGKNLEGLVRAKLFENTEHLTCYFCFHL